MNDFLPRTGGVLLRSKDGGPASTPTTTTTETIRQEMKHELQRYCCEDPLDSSYSDNIGFPTLPRPKAVLSVSCGSRTPLQSLRESAGSPRRNGWLKDKKLEGLHPVAKTKVNNFVQSRVNLSKQTGTGSSSNGIAATGSSSYSKTECKSSSLEQPRRSVSISSTSEVSTIAMSNKSRVLSRKTQTAGVDDVEEFRSKKRNSARSKTFSFGANSERKKRSLSFLKKGDKKGAVQEKVASLPPDSPILVTRKNQSMPVATASTELPVPDKAWKEDQSQLKNIRNDQHHPKSGSCQDISRKTASPQLEQKFRPPNLSLSSSARGYSTPGDDDESPMLTEYSPGLSSNSAMSSIRNSPESMLTSSAQCENTGSLAAPVIPMGKRHSLEPSSSHGISYRLDVTPPLGERKFSDPAPSTPEPRRLADELSNSSGCRGIKKRYTFCVRPSQDAKQRRWEMREHVVRFLVETEQSYVESLRRILKVYYEPLKRPQAAALVDSNQVKEIFYQIPEICTIHEKLLQQLTTRVNHWDSEKKIGDIFVNTFSKCQLMDIYSKFIGNFMRAKASIETAKQAKPVFAKFLEQKLRDSEGKLSLDDLLIKPVQRIPRYVLFIKDLLKHTGPSHPDHAPLQKALGELTMLAERFNDREKERERLGHHKELLSAVDGLGQLLSPYSYFIRYDMITEVKGQVQKRDRFLILFSDILVCASSRRKGSSFKRSSMLNLNSVFSEGLKYNIKWHLPLTKTSVGESATSCDQRKLSTVEKMLESLQKDEQVLEQLMELSTTISHPHQGLATALRDLHAEVRDSVTSKKEELENQPVECSRMDLIGYISATPTQYSVIFPSQKIRQCWEEEFLQAKKSADNKAPPYASIAPPTSPFPAQVTLCQELEFRNSAVLQSGRIGTILTCAAEGLSVDPSGVSCLWVCSSDRLAGKLSLVSLHPSTRPHIASNIPVSDSPITCISAVRSSSRAMSPSSSLPSSLHPTDSSLPTIPPNISINSTSPSSSTSSSPNPFHFTISPAHSIGSDTKSAGGEKDDDMMFLDGDLELLNLPDNDSNEASFAENSLTVNSMARVRSNSAPPYPTTMENGSHLAPEAEHWNFSNLSDSSQPTSSNMLLKPSMLKDDGGCGYSMWLGTEGGQVLIYDPGDNISSQSSRQVLDFDSPIQCISCVHNNVLIGLENGSVSIVDSAAPLSPRTNVYISDEAVQFCIHVMGEVWVGSEDTLYRLDMQTHMTKKLCSLPSGQTVRHAVVRDNCVWVSLQRSSLLYLLHAPSGEVIASVDCTRPVMDVLKAYNPIIRQHKSAELAVTALQLIPSYLVVGTSAGIVLTVPLPFIEPSLEPYCLLNPPVPIPLYQGHVDSVHFLCVANREDKTLVITGGNGCEDFFKAGMSLEIPETASCMLVWNVKH